MNLKRMIRDIGFMTRMTSSSRARYAKKKNIFNAIGNNVRLPSMRLPLYPKLVTFHDNIEVASNVQFITHDAIHGVLNNLTQAYPGRERSAPNTSGADNTEIQAGTLRTPKIRGGGV